MEPAGCRELGLSASFCDEPVSLRLSLSLSLSVDCDHLPLYSAAPPYMNITRSVEIMTVGRYGAKCAADTVNDFMVTLRAS